MVISILQPGDHNRLKSIEPDTATQMVATVTKTHPPPPRIELDETRAADWLRATVDELTIAELAVLVEILGAILESTAEDLGRQVLSSILRDN